MHEVDGADGGGGALGLLGFVAGVCLVFIGLGAVITDLQGGGVSSVGAGVSPERGEAIFWGTGPVDGTCGTCHSVGERGTMQRGPNLGEGQHGADIFTRAGERALERSEALGQPFSAADYLVESIADPSAYVVDGFPDRLMPLVFTGSIDLESDDVLSVLAYLQSLGGEVDLEALQASMGRVGRPILDKASAAGDSGARPVHFAMPIWEVLEPEQLGPWTQLADDAAREAFEADELDEEQADDLASTEEDWVDAGREVFRAQKCWQCHLVQGEDFGAAQEGDVGPELTGIGSIQTFEYLMESIANPNAMIVPPLDKHARGGHSRMPSYAASLTLEDLLKLSFYLSRLQPPGAKTEGP